MPTTRDIHSIRKLLIVVLAALAPHGVAAAAEGGLRVVYDTTETIVSPPGSSSPGEKTTRRTLTARLAPAALAVREGDEEHVYDFGSRRVVFLDHAKKESREFSLYATVGFLDREMENRKMLAQMLSAIGRAADMADVETELGMRQEPPAQARLKEQRRGNVRQFTLNDREVTSFLASDTVVPPALAPALARLFIYGARLHPLVRAELLKDPRLPAQLEYRWQLVEQRTTVTWKLREIAEEPFDVGTARATYPMKPLETQGLLEQAWRVHTRQAGTPPAVATYTARAERLLAEGRGFESFLVAVESSFATGHVPEDLLRRARDKAGSDPRMQTVARSMELEARDPKGALAQLEPLEPAGLEGGHVIHVLRANQHVRLNQGRQALQEFTHALTANPFLIGPWIDAGQLHHTGYEMAAAWTCWDAARAIAADHPMLKRVDELEASLRRRHPEYF